MSIIDAVGHIKWTLDKSRLSYRECRDMLVDLRVQLVNAELKYQEETNARNKKSSKA